jgi:hypothetical protein
MQTLRQLLRLIIDLLVGWIAGIWWLLRRLASLFKPTPEHEGSHGREHRTSIEPCVPIRHPALQKPDPLIYSQQYFMDLGMAVTWDNPDIVLLKGGVPVESSALEPDTDYQITARIWNASADAPVIGLPVHFSVHGFGIGTAGIPLGTTTVDLGVLGGPGCPALAAMNWRTPSTAGHYCIRVTLDWFDDANPNNNVGQENTNVVAAASPAQGTFTLRNDDLDRRHEFRLEADAYALPNQDPCEEARRTAEDRRDQRLAALRRARRGEVDGSVRERHALAAFPIPQGWSIAINPDRLSLNPGEEQVIQVVVDPPAEFTGRRAINVNAFRQDTFAGGVTLLVEKL